MVSFQSLWEQMDKSSPLMTSGEESKAAQVVRAGLALRNDGDTPFWDDLIQLCANADGLAELLGVKREAVTSWASRIKDTLAEVEKQTQNDPKEADERDEMLPTGENGAMTTKNMDSFGRTNL